MAVVYSPMPTSPSYLSKISVIQINLRSCLILYQENIEEISLPASSLLSLHYVLWLCFQDVTVWELVSED